MIKYIFMMAFLFMMPSIAMAQKASQPAGTFMASPCGSAGFFAPRTLCASDVSPIVPGGDLAGTLAVPTIAKIQGTTISGTTGNGNAVLSSGPTLTAPSIIGAGNNSTITATDTGTATSYITPGFAFVESESFTHSSAVQHFAFQIIANKNAAGSTTTGSRQGFGAIQSGAGGTASDYFTGGFEIAQPCNAAYGVTCNSFNLGGNFTGNNPYVWVPAGMSATSAVGEEVDVTTLSSVGSRQGLRIADIGSTAAGTTVDAALNIVRSGIGFATGIQFGDNAGDFPLVTGSTLIGTPASITTALRAGLDLEFITGAYSLAPIVLAPNNKGVWWGGSHAGGSIVSETGSNGGDIVFGNTLTAFRFGGTSSVIIQPNSIQLAPLTIAQLLAITCNSASEGTLAYVKDTVGNAAATYHGTVTGGGVTAIHSEVGCNGTNWQYN